MKKELIVNEREIRNSKILPYIQKDGNGRVYAWEFFVEPTTVSKVSQKLYPKMYNKSKKESWAYYLVIKRFNDWKNKKYFSIEKLNITKKDNRRPKGYKAGISHFIFNLNPLFELAKKKGIEFTPQQKGILEFLLWSLEIRRYIHDMYRDTNDFITGILKFYISTFIRVSKGIGYNKKELEKKLKKSIKNQTTTIDITSIRKQFVRYPKEKIKKEYLNKKYGSIIINKKNISYSDRSYRDSYITPDIFFFYYEEFHNKLKKVMNDLDNKILKLLDL